MSSSEYFLLHKAIRYVVGVAAGSFFTEIRVIGEENVPKGGPIIVMNSAATHHNMILDPIILSTSFPYKRILHYWSKASLYANPVVRYILLSTGNIPVDRKSKDRQVLFKGTFEALAKGGAVALFPEGTSYTEPRIMQVKDGAAWAALEYTKWLKENPEKAPSNEVKIIPAAIVYTNKSKYRSNVIVEYGRPISMDAYLKQFNDPTEGEPRLAAKSLTKTLENELIESTINALDWDTLYTARMARDLMWTDEKSINMDEFVIISQTLVDLFSTTDATANFVSAKRNLLEYYSLLQSANLTNSVLSRMPLPRSLDPNVPTPLPSRLITLLILLRDTLACLARLPFFLFPVVVHLPVYVMGRLGARLVEDEEETQAQNKIVFGLLSMMMVYPAAFFFLWAFLWYSSAGALAAAVIVYLFARYHNTLIDDNYEHAKRLYAAWRALVGVWAPKGMDLSLAALSQYTTPVLPKENPWIDRPNNSTPEPSSTPTKPGNVPTVLPGPSDLLTSNEPPVRSRRKRRPPTRRIMRHVLRARVEAVKALAVFFDQLERAETGKKVKASRHLARIYGFEEGGEGWRSATEVVRFLRAKGAKIPSVSYVPTEEDWMALSSDGEGTSTPIEE
ncbi:acyltransferase [Armillaria solidipes]|uniref:Acyltransferase n=1 Tax=Armillaria solidipes TaxID=1076256 RepID=A0A2H3C2G4_9AGAR|nr:acyltransferase [Armillaria solidipes]